MSITHNSPRQHTWSFIASSLETQMVVHVILTSLVLLYHSLETTSSVTVKQGLGKDGGYIMLTLCGMGRAVASRTFNKPVQNLINILQMPSSYDCVLMRILVMKIFQLRSLNSMYSKYA